MESNDTSNSGFSLVETLLNCSSFHCKSDLLSSSSVSCRNAWEVSFEEQKYSPYVAVIQAFYFVISFCWNLIIIVNFIRQRKLLKDHPACIYLLNLTVINFMFSIFIVFQCLLVESGKYFFIGSTDIFRCRICEVLGFMILFLATNSLHTLAILSFDRFLIFMKPMKYCKLCTWKSALLVVFLNCLWCICLSLPPYFGLGQYSFNNTLASCHTRWTGYSVRGIPNFNYIILIVTEALVPITLLIITNVWSVKIILKSVKKRHERWLANVSSSMKEEVSNKIKLANSRKQWVLMKVYGAIFIANALCWTPILIVLIAAAILGAASIPDEVYLLVWLFVLTIPVINPMTETYFIKDLRMCLSMAKQKFRQSLASSHGHIFRSCIPNTITRRHTVSIMEPRTKAEKGQRQAHTLPLFELRKVQVTSEIN